METGLKMILKNYNENDKTLKKGEGCVNIIIRSFLYSTSLTFKLVMCKICIKTNRNNCPLFILLSFGAIS